MLINVTLNSLVRIRKMKLLSLIISFSITAMKRKYLRLTFKVHIEILCKKTGQKIGALSRLLNHLSDSRKIIILNSIIKSQFNYCRRIWMFCSRTSDNMINKIHERALRLILNNHTSDFDTPLQSNNDTCSHFFLHNNKN